jgi:hypothetical protein
MRDLDGTLYVVDGRHHTAKAKLTGEKIDVVIVHENEVVGRQSAIDRVIGMLLNKK